LLSLLHQFPLYGEDVIDSGQKPPSIKVLVWLTSLCPFGVSHVSLSAYARPYNMILILKTIVYEKDNGFDDHDGLRNGKLYQ
jgi:hypothetical protein